MAVYGKNKEKWYPRKQSKVKVSKNRTIEWAKTADGSAHLKDFLWCHVASNGPTGTIRDIDGSLTLNTAPTVVTDVLSVIGSSTNLIASPVTSARFNPAGTGFSHNTTQQCLSANINFAEADFWTKTGTYKYISLWVKIDQQHAGGGSDGHTILAIGRSQAAADSVPHAFDPWMSLSTNSSRNVELRFSGTNSVSSGTGDASTAYGYDTGQDVKIISYASNQSLTDSKWHHVLFSFDGSSTCKAYIDGILAGLPSGVGTYTLADRTSAVSIASSIRLGNKCGGYSTIDTTPKTISGDAGFDGSIAEFSIFTLEQSPDDVARIVYEASREGVHALHSGIHNSSPRLEQLDLDRDSLYPPNHSLDSYTKFEDPVQYESNRDIRVSLKSTDAFQEGYKQTETWEERAGKYHIQSTISGTTETVTTMPHLRLNPDDTILTSGNWYSDARSEFFPEDLDATSGFVVSNTNDTATIKHVPLVSDELYREHVTSESMKPFLDADMPNEFKDCFVIEIPLPHIGGSLKLSTDAEDIDGSAEIAERRFDSANVGLASTVDPGQKINTMAYYNFKDKKWEYTVPSYSTFAPDGIGGSLEWTGTGDIGFSPMSGLVLPKHDKNLDYFSSLYGKPMTDCGFPFHKKFESEVGQTIDLSKYLDESVILEGWEIHCNVIPRVGYSHDISNGNAANTENGSTTAYSGMSKTPLYYGGTGEAAVFWDPDAGETIPFYEKSIGSGATAYRFDNTIPVSNFETSSSIQSDGTEKLTVIENKPTRVSKGLVTKGVTAFLLKETDLFDKSLQREKWLRSQPRLIAGSGNDLASGGLLYDYTRSQGFSGDVGKYHEVPDSTINVITETSVIGRRQPPLSYEFYEPNTIRYDRGSSREMIGYLQQVYHNDISGSVNRQCWTREHSSTLYGIAPNWGGEKSIIESLNKENDTYVANLLRVNTAVYPLSLSGSCKIQTPYAGSFPISNFKIAGNSGTDLGVYKHNTDPAAIDIYHSYAVIPSSEGSTFSDMTQHDAIPSIQGKSKSVSILLPESIYPCAAPTSAAAAWPTAALSPFDISIPENEDCDVVLRPTDKLILGIQDSVSTCFASQQIQHDASGAEFVRWGRNYLEIPNSQSGYLRLYVKRTRNDKTFNITADSSSYSANVNRDLGDQLIDDTYVANTALMYSGSMADDIMGPTFFTAPIMHVKVSVPTAFGSLSPTSDGSQGSPHAMQAMRTIAYASQSGAPGNWISRFSRPPSSSPDPWEAGGFKIEEFKIPWYNASASLFQNRSETVTPRYPAITWNDTWASFDSNRQWHNAMQVFHWPLAKAGTTTDADNNPQPYAWGHSTSTSPFRGQPWAHPNELNTNSGASTHVINSAAAVSLSLMGYDSPGMSAWNLNLMLPVFFTPSSINAMTPTVTILQTEIRLVKIIDQNYSTSTTGVGSAAGAFAQVPQYSDGTNMAVGDAFYFDDSQNCVKIDLQLDPAATIPANQKVFRNWMGQRDAKVGPIIFIVAGAISLAEGSPKALQNNSLTYSHVYSIVSRIAYIHSTWDESILCTVSNSWNGTLDVYNRPDGHDGSFTLSIPQDPVLRKAYSTAKDDLNELMAFKLCGVTIDPSIDIEDLVDENIRFWKSGGTPTALTTLTWNGVLAGGMLSTGTFDTHRSNFISNYFRPMYTPSGPSSTIVHNNTPVDMNEAPDGASPLTLAAPNATGSRLSHAMYQIDFTGMVSSSPILEIVDETYNDVLGRRIDRFVQRRVSSKNANPDIGPLIAGPFGQLKKYIHLESTLTILDSLPSKNIGSPELGYCGTYAHKSKSECNAAHADNWNDTTYMTLLSDIPLEFPFENTVERIKDVTPTAVKIKMKTAIAGGRWDTLTTTVDYTETLDGSASVYSWRHNAFAGNEFSDGVKGFLNVTNYIQKDFKGNSDYTIKTARDLLIGFGDGVSGKHLLKPELYDYKGWTGTSADAFATEYKISKPRGARFGQFNTQKLSPSYKFSYTHFGYLRDMLEQGLDTKFINHANDERLFGSPVVVNAINITNPEIPKLMTNTSRYNKTINATVTKPYIESNYEVIQQQNNLESETLRVDVAGAIRSNRVLAPGSIANNIRTR
jgi:hypothetical protein